MKLKSRTAQVILAGVILGAMFLHSSPGRGEISEYGNPFIWVRIGQVQVKAEVVQSPGKCFLGLSYRRDLPEGRGMLFLLSRVEPQVFCMRGMKFPIDIIWIVSGKVAGLEKRVSPEFKGDLTSPVPVNVVLEVPGGFAERYGIREGDRVHWAEPQPLP